MSYMAIWVCRSMRDSLNKIKEENYNLTPEEVELILEESKLCRDILNANIEKAKECPDYNKQIQEEMTRKVRIQDCRQFFAYVLEELEIIIGALEKKKECSFLKRRRGEIFDIPEHDILEKKIFFFQFFERSFHQFFFFGGSEKKKKLKTQ